MTTATETKPKLSAPRLMKGNEAAVHGALLAGCRCFFGYPITPASEIAHAAAELFPKSGGVFLQAESEIAAIQMVYGSASTGLRSMTASSSPGISLKQEGISYAAGAELPMVIVDVTRGGPGLGSIAPEQADYFQMVKGGGHGDYRTPVLAPNSAQEMCDLTKNAFEIADRYRTPVVILVDGLVGQMQEPVALPEPIPALPNHDDWSVQGNEATRKNLISSIYLSPPDLEKHVNELHAKYRVIAENETAWEEENTEDADIVLVGYGVVSRILRGVMKRARNEGLRVGLFRPITLWPFPTAALFELGTKTQDILVSELSQGQMVEDVRLAVRENAPVHFYGRSGGVLPTENELYEQVKKILEERGDREGMS